MKKYACLSLMLIAVFALVHPLSAQWVQTSEPYGMVVSLGVSGTSLLAGTWNGVYRSTDYGDTWNLTLPSSMLSAVEDFALDSVGVGNRIIYAGGQGGVYLSIDDGMNWQAINLGLENRKVRSLAVIQDETEGSTLLAGTDEGVFRSSDNGTSWLPSGLTDNNCPIYALTIIKDETDGTIILAGIDREFSNLSNCIFRSTDNGQSWIETTSPTLWASSFAIIPNSIGGTNIFAGTYSGVYLSTDNGARWIHLNIGEQRSVWTLVTSENENGSMNLFAGTFLGGVFLSTDNGVNWETVNSGLLYDNDWIYSLAVSGQYIFAGTSNLIGGIWRRPLSEILPSTTSVRNLEGIPSHFSLDQNYSNPFNPSTKISWQSPVGSHQTLKVYDVLGNEVATLVDEYKPSGSYEVEFDASSLPSGTYFYRLRAGSFVETKKMILIK